MGSLAALTDLCLSALADLDMCAVQSGYLSCLPPHLAQQLFEIVLERSIPSKDLLAAFR
jgi:hypothetical protein